MKKILQNYPFKKLNPPVQLVEGFAAYDGTLGDKEGVAHKGIDYVRRKNKDFLPFKVFAMHDGVAFQGVSETWGKFVTLRKKIDSLLRYDTIYAHLGDIAEHIPTLSASKEDRNREGAQIKAGEYLGIAGVSGNTQGIVQLHIELHEKDLKTRKIIKRDPYGLEERASEGNYPQPGESLKTLEHFWSGDVPPFAS